MKITDQEVECLHNYQENCNLTALLTNRPHQLDTAQGCTISTGAVKTLPDRKMATDLLFLKYQIIDIEKRDTLNRCFFLLPATISSSY